MRLRLPGSAAVLMLGALLLVGCGAPQATPTPAATPTPLPPTATPTPIPRTISGQITYGGRVTSSPPIIIVANRAGQDAPAYSAILSKPGPYVLSDVADGTYTLLAFMDLGDDRGPPQPNEPMGWYDPDGDGKANPVVMSGGKAVTGIDIVLRDPK